MKRKNSDNSQVRNDLVAGFSGAALGCLLGSLFPVGLRIPAIVLCAVVCATLAWHRMTVLGIMRESWSVAKRRVRRCSLSVQAQVLTLRISSLLVVAVLIVLGSYYLFFPTNELILALTSGEERYPAVVYVLMLGMWFVVAAAQNLISWRDFQHEVDNELARYRRSHARYIARRLGLDLCIPLGVIVSITTFILVLTGIELAAEWIWLLIGPFIEANWLRVVGGLGIAAALYLVILLVPGAVIVSVAAVFYAFGLTVRGVLAIRSNGHWPAAIASAITAPLSYIWLGAENGYGAPTVVIALVAGAVSAIMTRVVVRPAIESFAKTTLGARLERIDWVAPSITTLRHLRKLPYPKKRVRAKVVAS